MNSILRDKISAVESQMKLKLDEARATFAQGGDKGSSLEGAFRRFLRQYLPQRLAIGQGEIIDTTNKRSKQTDIVIATEDHPFTFTPDLPGLFFVEGVCAAGEVKANLSSTELEQALQNSLDFKQLEIKPGKNTIASTNQSDRNRFYKCTPWFLFAYESQISLQNIHKKILEFANSNSIENNRLVDAAFILGRGWVINFGDGEGAFKFRTPQGESVGGFIPQETSSVLFDFLAWLHAVMPRMLQLTPILPHYIFPRASDSRQKKD